MAIPQLYTTVPPPLREILDENPTLIVTWWATLCSIFMIFCRVFGRYVRTMRLFRDDWWMLGSIIPLLIRLGLSHAVLKNGTNNTQTHGLTEEEIAKRATGSGLVLAARVFLAMYIWIQKFCITEFYKRLTSQFWKGVYDRGLKIVRWGLLVTFLMVVVSTFAECQPFTHYWQVVPDPGPKCRQASAQLLTYGVLNIFTDIVLVIFPIPAIIYSQMPNKRKVQLISLFSLSFLVVAVSAWRIVATLAKDNVQGFRTLTASLEIFIATFAANALILNAFLRDKGPKRAKFKDMNADGTRRTRNGGSQGGGMMSVSGTQDSRIDHKRRGTEAGAAYWGSDEDLVRDMGVGHGGDIESQHSGVNNSSGNQTQRPINAYRLSNASSTGRAPYIAPTATTPGVAVHTVHGKDSNWGFPVITVVEAKDLAGTRQERRLSDGAKSDGLMTDGGTTTVASSGGNMNSYEMECIGRSRPTSMVEIVPGGITVTTSIQVTTTEAK